MHEWTFFGSNWVESVSNDAGINSLLLDYEEVLRLDELSTSFRLNGDFTETFLNTQVQAIADFLSLFSEFYHGVLWQS